MLELARHFSDEFGMSIICLRIGSFQERPRNERHLATCSFCREAVADLAQVPDMLDRLDAAFFTLVAGYYVWLALL